MPLQKQQFVFMVTRISRITSFNQIKKEYQNLIYISTKSNKGTTSTYFSVKSKTRNVTLSFFSKNCMVAKGFLDRFYEKIFLICLTSRRCFLLLFSGETWRSQKNSTLWLHRIKTMNNAFKSQRSIDDICFRL